MEIAAYSCPPFCYTSMHAMRHGSSIHAVDQKSVMRRGDQPESCLIFWALRCYAGVNGLCAVFRSIPVRPLLMFHYSYAITLFGQHLGDCCFRWPPCRRHQQCPSSVRRSCAKTKGPGCFQYSSCSPSYLWSPYLCVCWHGTSSGWSYGGTITWYASLRYAFIRPSPVASVY